jgi:GT2 family glycosyltransferase
VSGCDVVIVNYNTGLFLRDAVASALQSAAVARVIVVDNASDDGSVDGLPPGGDKPVEIVRNPANLGFAAGCNIGLARASSEHVLLLNPDCVVQAGAIERLVEVASTTARAGMVGPLLLNPDGTEQAAGRRAVPTPLRAILRGLRVLKLHRLFPGSVPHAGTHLDPLPRQPVPVEAISGACMLVTRAAMADVGPLDEQYFLHCEDLDWCMRFHQRGWAVLFVPDAEVLHYKGVSSRCRPIGVEWYKHRSMIRFYRKFLRDRYSAVTMGVIVAGIWLRFAAVAGYLLISRPWKRQPEAFSGKVGTGLPSENATTH